ncbi:MAG: hypothetical protein HQL31_14070, partial [Planctomycetes bacterium]|nr:hypothetical protein [Planctomycetota bacterium]
MGSEQSECFSETLKSVLSGIEGNGDSASGGQVEVATRKGEVGSDREEESPDVGLEYLDQALSQLTGAELVALIGDVMAQSAAGVAAEGEESGSSEMEGLAEILVRCLNQLAEDLAATEPNRAGEIGEMVSRFLDLKDEEEGSLLHSWSPIEIL